ncbi:hypothetical protein CSIM01_02001 [Colletotrichum simmondsii]|uniref:Uncharacterized protein n=1 Tax=Colletotrichum simmondsii TaxID=703756 RepID=A0A135SGG9_9PEZI|nr:hypothetical protein CSIM01_02001 [Colletotrichum simmondsii]
MPFPRPSIISLIASCLVDAAEHNHAKPSSISNPSTHHRPQTLPQDPSIRLPNTNLNPPPLNNLTNPPPKPLLPSPLPKPNNLQPAQNPPNPPTTIPKPRNPPHANLPQHPPLREPHPPLREQIPLHQPRRSPAPRVLAVRNQLRLVVELSTDQHQQRQPPSQDRGLLS